MMDNWILKFTDTVIEPGSEIVGRSVEFHGGVGLGWVLLMALGFAGVIAISYRWMPAEQSAVRKASLVGLRVAFVVLLLGILFRPILALELTQKIQQTLLVLIDSSGSMAITDPRVDTADIKRAAIAKDHLDPAQGLDQNLEPGRMEEFSKLARTNVLQSVLGNERLNLLPKLADKFELSAFTFGRGGQLRELPRVRRAQPSATNANPAELKPEDFGWIETLGAEHSATALGDSLRELLQRKRGQPLAGVLVISDGAQNSGAQPLAVGNELNEAGVPLYFYGVGITSPRDIIITEMDAPAAAFIEDELMVRVRVRSQGLAGQTGRLVLRLGDEEVDDANIAFGPDGEQVISMRFPTTQAGDFKLTAAIEARPDETDPNNNAVTRRLRIVDEKIKVLFVEQSPRWDYRYLQAMLARDRRVEVKTLLLESDPALARVENSPYLEQFPENKKDLFEYDVVIFGDVDPARLSGSQKDNLNEFVARFGGAFVMIAGRRFSPLAYSGTKIADMLPVEFTARPTPPGAEDVDDKPIHVELTALGKIDPMLNLVRVGEKNLDLWNDLPPIYWVSPVDRKPGAEVLMVDPSHKTDRGKRPIIARHQYGLGQVLFVGTDNTWRWRRNVGDLYYTRFWGQVSQRMAQQRFIGADKRTQISLNSQNYMAGEDRVRVFARLYQEGFEPFDEPQIMGVYTSTADGRQAKVVLKMVGGDQAGQKESQRGLYYGEFPAPVAGQYKFHLEPAPDTQRDFTVVQASVEKSETAMNAKLMQELAALSASRFAGATDLKDLPGHDTSPREHHPWFFREEDLHQLVDAIRATPVEVRSREEIELWAHPLYFILILLVVTVEWVVRKLSYLK